MRILTVAAAAHVKKRKTITQKDLVAGSLDHGWLGLIPSADFVSGSQLAALCGLSVGTLINNGTGWMSFAFKGKNILVPQKPIRHSFSWNQLNALGLITGKVIKIGDVEYKVRAFDETTDEWRWLMYSVSSGAASLGSKFANWNDATLVLSGDLPGQSTHTQQESGTTYLARGSRGVAASEMLAKSTASTFRGWRPVVEMIG